MLRSFVQFFKEKHRVNKAFTTAKTLVDENRDFRHWSVDELAYAILDENGPQISIDKTLIR